MTISDKIGLLTCIVTIIGILIALYDFIYKYLKHIQITNIEFGGPPKKTLNEIKISSSKTNISELMFSSFIIYFENTICKFYLKNKTTHPVEIHSCYLEVCFYRIHDKLLIPLNLIIKRDEHNINSFINDWIVAGNVDSYFLPEQSCTKTIAKIEKFATELHVWYLNNLKNTTIPNCLHVFKEAEITTWKLRCRVVCKDSFDKKYYSKPFKIKINLKSIYSIYNHLIKNSNNNSLKFFKK